MLPRAQRIALTTATIIGVDGGCSYQLGIVDHHSGFPHLCLDLDHQFDDVELQGVTHNVGIANPLVITHLLGVYRQRGGKVG